MEISILNRGNKVANEMDYQGIGIRLAAQIVDGIIFFPIFWIVGWSIAAIYGELTPTGFQLQGTPALLAMGILFIIWLAYFTILEGTTGQTVGKMLCKIKVVKEDENPCDLHTAFIRNILRVIDGIFVYLVGAIFIARSDKKQRLGDRVAKTIVVKK